MSISRRGLLRGMGGLAAYASLPWTVGCGDEGTAAEPETMAPLDGPTFTHGVASGDPRSDGVILWTRLMIPEPGSVSVHWQVAADPEFAEVVAEGDATTEAARDFTLKVDADGLEPATTYYYRFTRAGVHSPTGRTRTAPEGSVDRLKFAVVSCSSYAHGYFHAYRAIANREDLDAVIHLGDYIYEYGDGEYGDVRAYQPPHEILSLDDYRRRFAQYRGDANLLALHAQHPIIAVWDDHEVANNSWIGGAENHNPEKGEGDFLTRKAAATKAYFEWMPIRERADRRTFRQLAYGDLVDLIVLDTRHSGRTQQATSADATDFASEARTLLGMDQETWLADAMERSGARWRLIGQQVMVSPFAFYLNLDDWNGYPAARQRFLSLLARHEAKDTVVLTGDVHSSWAMNLVGDAAKYDPQTGRGALAVELVAPGITAPGLEQTAAEALHPMLLESPHVKYVDLWQRGYVVVDVAAEHVHAAWYLYPDVIDPELAEEHLAHECTIYAGEHCIRHESETPGAKLT